VVGACALKPTGGSGYELSQDGRPGKRARNLVPGPSCSPRSSRGRSSLAPNRSTSSPTGTCAAAIHLYEKLGFRHDAGIMADYGARYARCDVAMRYAL